MSLEADALPDGWREVLFGYIAKRFLSGGTPSTRESRFWDGSIAWTTSAPISETDVYLREGQRFISQSALENSATKLVPKNNLLVGTRVGVGKAVVNLIDVAISQDLTGVVLDTESVEGEFIAYQFKTRASQSFFYGRKRGTTIQGISRFDLQALPILLPPLAEQRAIARAQRAVQEAKDARRRESARERERKAALMHHLFTHGPRGEPTKHTEIGEMPEGWEVVRLGDAAIELGSGVTPRGGEKTYLQSGVPLIRSQNVLMSRLSLEDVAYISNETHKSMSRSSVMPGDILLNITGASIGRVAFVPEDLKVANVNQHVCRIRLAGGWSPEFVSYFLAYPKGQSQIIGSQFGTTRQGLNYGNVRAIKIPQPSLSEQQHIANVFQVCDAKIVALEREAAVLDELFRAMLEELMTGRLSATVLYEAAT